MHQFLDDESLALLQLNLTPGVGPRYQSLLLARFGSAQSIFSASPAELLSVDGIGPKVTAEIRTRSDFSEAEKEWELCCDTGTSVMFKHQANYPRSLLETYDPPPVLYYRGTLLEQDRISVGVVGSRQCSHYGRTVAQKFSQQLARVGITVISGLARGIDAAAHRGALEGGGRTLAVCAPGLNHIYPPEHRELSEEITQSGAIISESPLNRSAQRGLFPQRNRVIAGLSQGVLIVEATRTSGSLHTARHALEQGRDVFAIPGRIDTVTSEGCHDLIRDGAVLVRRVEDIIDVLGPTVSPVKISPDKVVAVARELNLNEQEQAVLNLVDFSAVTIDSILAKSDLESHRVLSTLVVLEMKRLIRRLPGGSIERVTG